jgi:hypothetical protein
MLLRLAAVFAALCLLAGALLLLQGQEPIWGLGMSCAAALVLVLVGLHCFNVAEARLPKWARRPMNWHAD